MKHKIGTLAAVSALLFLGGCADNFLDTSLDRDQTPETIATNRGTIWNFANTMYAPIEYGFSTIDNNLFAAATDEAQQTATSANAFTFNKGIISPTNNPVWSRYQACFEGIRAANFFIDYVADGKGEALLALNRNLVTDKTSYERDLLYLGYSKAEAQVVKAYYYGELLKMYGGVPIVENTIDQTNGKMYERKSYDEVVNYIVSQIDTYKSQLAPTWNSATDRNGRFSLGVALAIKSRVLLYAASPLNNPSNSQQKWIDAATAAHDIITNTTLGYQLASDYGSYFTGNNPLSSKETIYAVRNSATNTMESANYPIGYPGGHSGVTPTHNLVSAYEYLQGSTPDPNNPYAGRDPRLAASVVYNGSTWNGKVIDQTAGDYDMSKLNATRTGYYLKKFLTENLNLTQGATAQHNWVTFRYAEILLNYAEAMNEAYGPDNAAGFTLTARQALMMVRNRASILLPAVTATETGDFRAVLKHERMIELAFENHRYWDLLRWKDAETALNQPVTGVKITKSGSVYSYTAQNVATRKFDKTKNYLLPFDRAEIVNSKGTLIQNPGYEE